MKICNQHSTEFVHKTGTSKAGKAYDFWCCPSKTADGEFCQDKGIEKGNYESAQAFEKSVSDKRQDSFSTCNAMNNTVALIVGGKIEIDKLEECYRKLLVILES